MPLKQLHGRPIRTDLAMLEALAPAGPARQLPIPFIHQEQDNWCWAACCQMVLALPGPPSPKQCQMASTQFGGNCCASPSGLPCNQGCWPDVVFPHYGVTYSKSGAAISQAALAAEINGGRPVEIYLAWAGGYAHVALVTGYYANGDFEVHDPWYGAGPRSYDHIRTAYGLGSWNITYSNIRR